MADNSTSQEHAPDTRIAGTSHYGERHHAKMTKAMIGLGLMFALSITLSVVNIVHRWDARHPPAAAAEPPQGQGFDTAHLAPREDHSLH